MTLREIDRQFKHWAISPPPSLQLLRIGAAVGVPVPERADAGPMRTSTEDELRAMAMQFGAAVPEVSRGG